MTKQVNQDYVLERWNPWLNKKRETHLEYTVWFTAADGHTQWLIGTLDWSFFIEGATLCDYVLLFMTDFVKAQWFRMEVCIPNRNEFGNLKSGYIKDTGILLATRQLKQAA